MCDLVGSDLSRLRSFIHQGKRKKLEYFLNDLSGRREQILSREFDACSYATKFKQEHLLELLADFGFPVDGFPSSRSVTALIIAIRRCDLKCVKTLIGLGCDVNYSTRSFTIIPLMEAYKTYRNKRDNESFLFEDSKSIIRCLLESGASPNIYNIHTLRLVHLAVNDGEFEVLQMFLDFGADINAVTKTQRRNLLHFICDRVNFEENEEVVLNVARTLIRLGCDMNHRDYCFETPLMCALRHGGNLRLAYELIVEGTHLDLKNNFGNTYLTRAVHHALYDHARMALFADAPFRSWQWTFSYAKRNYIKQQSADNSNTLMDAIADYEHFTNELESYLSKPRTLKDLSRLFLRKLLPLPLSQGAIGLTSLLPRSLIDYLLLSDMKGSLKLNF